MGDGGSKIVKNRRDIIYLFMIPNVVSPLSRYMYIVDPFEVQKHQT
jgi:hypothetical protein